MCLLDDVKGAAQQVVGQLDKPIGAREELLEAEQAAQPVRQPREAVARHVELDVSRNGLTRLPHGLCGLLSLKKLLASANRLVELPDDLLRRPLDVVKEAHGLLEAPLWRSHPEGPLCSTPRDPYIAPEGPL